MPKFVDLDERWFVSLMVGEHEPPAKQVLLRLEESDPLCLGNSCARLGPSSPRSACIAFPS